MKKTIAKQTVAKITAAMAAAAMLMTGCAAGTDAAAPAAAPEAAADAAEETAASEAAETTEETAAETAEEAAAPEDITEIDVFLWDMGGSTEGTLPIIEAANAITEKTIGVHANISFIPVGDYGTQLNLALAGGEDIDLINIVPIPPADFGTLSSNKQLMDITDILEEEGRDILDMMGVYASSMNIGGRTYGIPTYRSYGSSDMLMMRKDVLEDLGLLEKAQNATSWTEITEIFAAVAEQTDMTPIGGGQSIIASGNAVYNADKFVDSVAFDPVGDGFYLVFNKDGKLSLLPEEEAFRTQQEMIRGWYDSGYVLKDSTLESIDAIALLQGGQLFSMKILGEIGADQSWSERCNHEMITVELGKNIMQSSQVANFAMGVPVTADEPEAAIRWLNALYTDPALENLLCWGIENEDYVVRDGVAYFPEGKDATTVRFHKSEFAYGNYFNLLPWDGAEADFRQKAMEYLDEFEVSRYFGFSADLSGLDNTIAALTTVRKKYQPDVMCGAYTDEEYDAYISELKAAGVDDYLGGLQEQLDAWVSANQ